MIMQVTRNNPASAIEGVYLLHFETKYKHSQHYLGYGTDVHRRVQAQLDCKRTAAKFVKVVHKAGIKIVLARLWLGATRTRERQIKNTHNLKSYCPICRETVDVSVDINFYK
jgi:predicted GIY-YIG superfamily endonuclease